MALKNRSRKNQSGFTIVELLIVIVVIAILAAISIVAYTGIQNRARTNAGMQLASQVAKKMEAYHAIHGTYPTARADIASTSTTLESRIDGVTSATTAQSTPLLLDASANISNSTALTSGTANNGTTVRVVGSPTGGVVRYWDFTSGTSGAEHAGIRYGAGS